MSRQKVARGILVFGGAFDPPHQGHLRLILEARRGLKPHKTIVLPTFSQPVHKQASLFPPASRLLMLKEVFKKLKGVEVSGWELLQKKPVFTWQALRWLHRRFPGSPIYFLIGSDNAGQLSSWGRLRDLQKDPLFILVIGRRPGFEGEATGFHKAIWLKGVFPRVSSTEIRRLIVEKGERARPVLSGLMPKAALKLILFPETLETRIHAYLKTKQPASRYSHTLSVARLAGELSRLHGVDENKAKLAALLHDASRHTETFKNSRDALGHAGRSVHIARHIFGIKDREILEAIAWHTVGNPKMGKLARLVYVADLASYDRKFSEAASIRALARRNLDAALKTALEVKLNYLRRAGKSAHSASRRLLESLS